MSNTDGSAVISDCGSYRYLLRRHLLTVADAGPVLFVMLNPSTADAQGDDPTIRRCKGFARLWGCDCLTVVNLYGLRATKPKDLWVSEDPFGPLNDHYLRRELIRHGRAVCAWGGNARRDAMLRFFGIAHDVGAELLCLGVTKAGDPRHPLYLRKDTRLERWFPNL